MLSSQTKDEVTHAAVQNLSQALGELTIDNVLSADDATLEAAICKVGQTDHRPPSPHQISQVGFWRRKTQ